jgi:hypothetical protein
MSKNKQGREVRKPKQAVQAKPLEMGAPASRVERVLKLQQAKRQAK